MSTREALRLQLASGLAGVLGGLGAVAFQWLVRHPSHALVVTIVQILAYVLFALSGLTTVGVMARELRGQRRFVSMLLYIGVAFVVTLYAFGGRWPFWRP
jgi:predicted membrane channel-forming protein YqfA (hemolysin III family)